MSNHLTLPTNLRLTARGKLVLRIFLVSIALTALAVLLVTLWSQQPIAPAVAADEQASGVYQKLVVQPGDTLWEISSRLAHDNEQSVVMEQIMTYNDLETSDLEVGQTLFVPVGQN